jgi:hypothetical protein
MLSTLVILVVVSCVFGGPTSGPVVAVINPGTNFTATWEAGAKPPSILANVKGIDQLSEKFYHRLEFQFLDFQMNQTLPFANDLVQNIEIYLNLSFGAHPQQGGFENFTESSDGIFSANPPDSVTGFTQLFSGLYNGGSDNKVNVDRTITGDMCGVVQDKGYFEIWVRPVNGQTTGAFREGYFMCFFNLNIQDGIFHEPDSQWSQIFQCNSGSLNNYSHRLWYKLRYYNIDPKICNAGNIRTF